MSNDLLRLFKTDGKLEKDGIWIEYGLNSRTKKPMRFRIGRSGGQNTAYNKALERATRPYRKQIQSGVMDPDLANSIVMRVFCETVLKEWEEIDNLEGNAPLEFKEENAVEFFTALPELYEDLMEQSKQVSLFREFLREEDLGNSGGSSATGSSKGQSKAK